MKKAKIKKDVKSYWSMTEGVFNCLIDEERSRAFQEAIKNTVKPGDVVVDMGTGSGILAMFAAKAGASKVYAVENDRHNILTLNNTFKVNKLDKIIEIIEGDVTKVKLPEKVDVIIGEMIATALIEELQIPAMNNMLKYTKKECRVLLNKYDCGADLVFNKNRYYDLNFPILRYEYSDFPNTRSEVYTDTVIYKKINFEKINKNNLIKEKISLKIKKDGIVNAIRLSGKTYFCDGSTFKDSFAYSFPIIIPINEICVTSGQIIVFDIEYGLCSGIKNLSIKLK